MRTILVLSLFASGAMPAVAAAAPAGEWHLDEPSWEGGVLDSSGNHHDGVALGGAVPLEGHGSFPNAPGCASCAVVDVPGDLGLGGAAAITVSAWVRWSIDPATAPPRAVIVSQSSSTTPVGGATTANAGLFWIRLGGDPGNLAYQFGVRVGRVNVFVTGMTPPRKGVWTHVTGVYDGAYARIYVDGALENATAVSGAVAPMRPEYRFQMGAAPVDEGGSLGRRAFSGDLDEVRVYAAAVPPADLRATACASGPAEALATFCGGDTPMCPACLDLTLIASRASASSKELTAARDLCRPVRVAVPERLNVVAGKASDGKATLVLDDVTCSYAGDGSLAYPLASCSDGSGPGAAHLTSRVSMRVRTGLEDGGATRVAVTLEEIGALPVLRLSGPADGSYVDGAVTLGATASGAGGPLALLLDGATYDGSPVSSEGPHLFSATAPGCHQPEATASLSFTIDATPPALQVVGVRDGEVREGPVLLRIVASDASPVVVIPSLDGRAFEGTTATVSAPGQHLLGVSAIDGAGHFTTTRTTFTIVELRVGLDETPVVDRSPSCPRVTTETRMEELCLDPCVASGRSATFVDVSEGACREFCDSREQQEAITRQRCEDRRWLDSYCGRLEQARWTAVVNTWIAAPGEEAGETSICADLKAELGVGQDSGATVDIPAPPPSTVETRLSPMTLALGDGSVKDVDPHTPVAQVTHFGTSMPGMHHSGGTATFGAIRRGESVKASSTNPIVTGLQLLSKLRRQQWEANGNQVMSCEEYVYEKHYNVSKFYDEVERHGGNFRAYVNAAFAPEQSVTLASSSTDLVGGGDVLWPSGMLVTQVGTTVSLPPAYALGTMAELGWPFRSRNGAPTMWPHRLEELSPHTKNVFFSMPTRAKYATEEDVAALIKSLAGGSSLPCSAELGGLSWLGVCDHELADKVQAGNAISVDRTWSYHHQMSDLLAKSYSDEDLYLADQMKDRYQQLLDWRARITGKILFLLHSAEQKGYVTLPAPDLPWNIYTSPTDMSLVAMQTKAGLGVQSALAAHPMAASTTTSSLVGGTSLFSGWSIQPEQPLVQVTTASPVARVAPIMGQRWGSADQAHLGTVGGAMVSPVTSAQELQQRLGDMFKELYTVDALIEEALHEADRFGCLELQGPNPCDWSPRDFAQLVQSFTEPNHESEYLGCVQNTAQVTFAELAAGHALGVKDDVDSTTPIPVHYGGNADGTDRVLAVGLKYQPAAGAPKVSKVFPQVRGEAFTSQSCTFDPATSANECETTTTYDATSCVLDAVGEPYLGYHDQETGGLPANPECPGCNVWTKDTDTLDLYFECLDLYKQLVYHAVAAKVGPLLDEKGRARLGTSASENESIGNGDWSLDYGYAFGWTFGNFELFRADPAAQCVLQPEMYGAMHFGARAMGEYIDVARGSAHARTLAYASDPVFEASIPADVVRDTIDAHVDLVVLEIDVVEPTQEGGTFSVVADGEERDKGDVPDPPITVPFAIGPVPMSLKAGLSGYVGVRFGAEADLDPLCQHQSLSAHFGPFAGIEGFASVGIDILVAEAGVKIAITIIEADLPFTESVGLTHDPQDGLSAYFNTNLDLVLKTLGGRFSLFLRILFARWEWDLFTWDGFVHKVNLMHTEMQVPLLPLTEAVNAISGPSPHMP